MQRTASLLVSLSIAAGLAGARAQTPVPPPAPQQPVFRTGTDVIRLDVTVLDKNRHPVHGLKDLDFTVYEDGKPQRIVAVAEIDGESNDPAPTAWMRHTPRDVASNDLADQTGDGRVFGIVMDDVNIPYDSAELVTGARDVGHYVVDQMRPSDSAAVIFPQQPGRTQDFTTDRGRLSAAIDKFQPERMDWIMPTPYGTRGGGGDMPYRYSSALARDTCERLQPTVPALHTLIARLASIPTKRKTVVLVSVGPPVVLDPTAGLDGCPLELRLIMEDAFAIAERANINVYGVDPGGRFGFANYLSDPFLAARRGTPTPQESRAPRSGSVILRHDFLRLAGEFTGARGIYEGDIWQGVDEMLAEADSYYLIGYQTPSRPDGKFHKVEVRVNKRPGVTARTKSGYYAAREDSLGRPEQRLTPTAANLGLSGMASPASLPLRAVAQPVGFDPISAKAEVAVTIAVRLPAPLREAPETLTLIRNVYDAAGRPGPPVQEKIALTLRPVAGDELRYEVWQRLTLAPGHYQLRYNATSTALDQSGSVFADLDVPGPDATPLSATPIILGAAASGAARTDALAGLLPILPTAAREFAASEEIVAFLRFFQPGGAPRPVTVTASIFDVANAKQLDETRTIAGEAFGPSGATDYRLALPLARLKHGPHLLSLTASLADGANLRRDLVFRVR